MRNLEQYLRRGASPGAAAALLRMNSYIDVRDVLPTIQVPTLVLHRTGDHDVNVAEGRYLADQDPGREVRRAPGSGPLDLRRERRRDRRRDRGVPDRHAAGAGARSRAGHRPLHRHRRLDRAGCRARRPPLARAAEHPRRGGAARARALSGPRGGHGRRRLPRRVRRPGARRPLRALGRRCRPAARRRDPRGHPHRRVRARRPEDPRHRRPHRARGSPRSPARARCSSRRRSRISSPAPASRSTIAACTRSRACRASGGSTPPSEPRRPASRSTSAPRTRARPLERSPPTRPGERGAARASRPSPARRARRAAGSRGGPRRGSPVAARRRPLPPGRSRRGRPASCAWPLSALAISATRPGNAAIASPSRRCSSSGRSRAGATTTTRGAPMKASGTSVPQSSGNSALAGSLPPYETPRIGSGASRSAAASAPSVSHSPTFPAVTTAKWPSTWTECGDTTTATSGAAAAQRRPSSSIAARSSGARSTSPCGAMQAKTRLTAARLSARRAARGSAPRRRRPRRPRSARDR